MDRAVAEHLEVLRHLCARRLGVLAVECVRVDTVAGWNSYGI
jgi:hypothetical protein